MIKTKIICTIGPSVRSIDMILQLIDAGMNVARLNFSHGTHEQHLETIDLLKEARKQTQKPLALMLDTQGPEIRLGQTDPNGILAESGKRIWLVRERIVADDEHISVTPSFILDSLTIGTKVLIDDGYVLSHVVDISEKGVLIEFENSGKITSSKGVNIPGIDLTLPAITEKDVADITFGCEQGVDFIAASFIRSADNILEIKKLLAAQKKSDVHVLAKIENNEGVQNFESILQVADGIMIARGDLGVEVPLSQVPRLQKMMIRKAYLLGKPSITATQMLESMIHNPRPTRAEVSDVANAIHDGTSAVMLSGETAIGKYPIATVKIMKSIISDAEQDFNYKDFFHHHSELVYHDVPSAITLAAVKTAYSLGANAIFAFTKKGSTAKLLSRLRPPIPIIGVTSDPKTYQQLAICWGVTPFLCTGATTLEEAFKMTSTFVIKEHLVSYGALIVSASGNPFWTEGTTKQINVENIGDVLVRGEGGFGPKIHGNVTLVPTAESKLPYEVRDQIIVIASCDKSYLALIREAAGIILQNHIDDTESERQGILLAKNLQKPIVVRGDGAFSILREGLLVTLEPEKGLVYKGVIK